MNEIKKILQTAILENGIQMQTIIAMEELAELRQAIEKSTWSTHCIDNLIEEMADVEIVIEEIRMFYGIKRHEIEQRKDEILNRPMEDLKSIIAMRKLAELQQAISKAARGKLNKDVLIQKMADVLIIIEFIRTYHRIDSFKIAKRMEEKIKRLEKDLLQRGVQINDRRIQPTGRQGGPD